MKERKERNFKEIKIDIEKSYQSKWLPTTALGTIYNVKTSRGK